MRKKICLWATALVLAGPALAQDDLPTVSAGKIQRLDIPTANVPNRIIDVWLPPGYAATKRYAVVYMQDGASLYDSSFAGKYGELKVDEALVPLFKSGKLRECIVVGIYNAGAVRFAEYWPQKVWEPLQPYVKKRLLEQGDGMGKLDQMGGSEPFSDAYLRFIVQEVKPYIDKNFSVMPERESTFIAGTNMGALVALYAVCQYPDVFGGAACLSTHWTGQRIVNKDVIEANMAYLKASLPPAASHKIYMDCGNQTLDLNLAPAQKEADAIFAAKGWGPAHYQSKVFAGHEHNEQFWAKRIPGALSFLLANPAGKAGGKPAGK